MEPSQRAQRRQQPKWVTYYVTLPYMLLAHEAWLTLVPKAQVILIDFKRHLDRMTMFGAHPIPRGGIPYSHGHCVQVIHRNTFYRNVRELEDRGFLRGTNQIDIDGQSTYYVPSSRWMTWTAPQQMQERVRRLKARIQHREERDLTLGCRISVHPPSHFERNPLLRFWSDPTAWQHQKSAPLPYDQNRDPEKHARTRTKQEEFQTPPTIGPYDPDEGADDRADFLAALRAKNAEQREQDAAAVEAMRAFPREP